MSLRELSELATQPYELSPICGYTSSRPSAFASKDTASVRPKFEQMLTWSGKQLSGHKQLYRLRFRIYLNQSLIGCVVTAGLHKLSGYHCTNIPTFTGPCATTPDVRVQSLCWRECAISVCHHAVVRPTSPPDGRLSRLTCVSQVRRLSHEHAPAPIKIIYLRNDPRQRSRRLLDEWKPLLSSKSAVTSFAIWLRQLRRHTTNRSSRYAKLSVTKHYIHRTHGVRRRLWFKPERVNELPMA